MKTIGKIKEKIDDIIYGLHSYRSKWRGRYERFTEIIKFIPTLWHCVTWDFSSIYKILYHWLGRVYICIVTSNVKHVGYESDLKKISIIRNSLKRLYEDDYDFIYKEHDERWGRLEFNTFPSKSHPELYQCVSRRQNAVSDDDKKQERKEYRFLMKRESEIRKQDIDTVFNYLKKYHVRWWI